MINILQIVSLFFVLIVNMMRMILLFVIIRGLMYRRREMVIYLKWYCLCFVDCCIVIIAIFIATISSSLFLSS